MADLAFTASAVLKAATAKAKQGISHEAITMGDVLYRVEATQRLGLADNNDSSLAVRTPVGIALNPVAGAGQPVAYLEEGDLTVDAVLTAGTTYYLSDTPGKICPLADLSSPTGQRFTVVGIARSTTVLRVKFIASEVSST